MIELGKLGASLQPGNCRIDPALPVRVARKPCGLLYRPEHWDETRLATWLCRNLPEQSLTHAAKPAYVAAWVSDSWSGMASISPGRIYKSF